MSTPPDPRPLLTDIVVAIHGIGAQSRYATGRSVATRLALSKLLWGHRKPTAVAPQPLGYFHGEVFRQVDDSAVLSGRLSTVGVAEAFWADIPQEVASEGRTLEETKAWARTVVARAETLCDAARDAWSSSAGAAPGSGGARKAVVTPDFQLASEVLDEVIDTVHVLENLTAIADKAGLFKFDLEEVLVEYLGDVQLVAEFPDHREKIVRRFHDVMHDVYERCVKDRNDSLRIHVVAHSEGTVVSFLGLLQAMAGQAPLRHSRDDGPAGEAPPTGVPDWLKHVHGYMTIGSPIDKHLLLWPRIWQGLKPDPRVARAGIRWRNYYDYGDPVGFKLDTARLWLEANGFEGFEFCGCPNCNHDVGFARYMMPGAAHNEYWDDPEVFDHFIGQVVTPTETGTIPPMAQAQKAAPKPPGNRPGVWLVSWAMPYVISFVVLLLGVYMLYKQVSAFTHPELQPLEAAAVERELNIHLPEPVSGLRMLGNAVAIAMLIAGTTVLARLPRLAVGARWRWGGVAGFLAGCLAYWKIVPKTSRDEIGGFFNLDWALSRGWDLGWVRHAVGPTTGVQLLALVVALLALWLTAFRKLTADERRRVFLRGMRPLLLCGALGVVLGIILPQALPRHLVLTKDEAAGLAEWQVDMIEHTRLPHADVASLLGAPGNPGRLANVERIQRIAPLVSASAPVWPLILGTAAFLYLWWLGALVFDLAFVWHRYIRRSMANQRLRTWMLQTWAAHEDPRFRAAAARALERRPVCRAAGPGAPA